MLTRSLYRVLLRMHPRCFRVSFEREMLSVFDEACAQYGAAWLLGDATLSLLRQWVLRSPEDARLAGRQGRFGLLAGSYPNAGPPHLTTVKLSLALLLTMTSFLLFPYPGTYAPHSVSKRADVRMEVTHGEHVRLRIRR